MSLFIELHVKPARRLVIDLGMIKSILTAEGFDCLSIAPPESPLTLITSNGDAYEVYGISVASIMVAMREAKRPELAKEVGWLPLP